MPNRAWGFKSPLRHCLYPSFNLLKYLSIPFIFIGSIRGLGHTSGTFFLQLTPSPQPVRLSAPDVRSACVHTHSSSSPAWHAGQALELLSRLPPFEHKIDIGEPERMKVNLSLTGIFGNCCCLQIFVQFTRRVSWNIKERMGGNTPWNLFAGICLLIFLDRLTCCRKSVQAMYKRTRQG